MSTYKLTYFDMRGRAEMIRIIFAAAGVEFTDVRLQNSEWGPLKATTPWGELPILEVDGQLLAQSVAISRFLGRKFQLAGGNEWDAAKLDEYIDAYNDVLNEWAMFTFVPLDAATKKEKMDKFKNTSCPKLLSKLESILKANGSNGHLVGSSLTWAEIVIGSGLETFEATIDANILKKYPEVTKMREVMENHPNVKKWMNKRPKEDIAAIIKEITGA